MENGKNRGEAETIRPPVDTPLPFFSSDRERRLWIWALVVIVAIYATLGLARTLFEVLGDEELYGAAFVIGFLMIWAAILTAGLRVRPGGFEIAVALGVAAVYLMVFARMGIPERTHLFEYGVVALFIYGALTERAHNGRRVPVPALLAILATTLAGALDECIQWFLPSRVFDPVDMGFNFIAAVMGVGGSAALGWARDVTIRFRRRRSGRHGAEQGEE